MDQRLIRLRVELFTAAQVLTNEDLEYFKATIRDVATILDFQVIDRARAAEPVRADEGQG